MNTFVWTGVGIFAAGFLLQLFSGLRYKDMMEEAVPIADTVTRKFRRVQIFGKMLFYAGITLSICTVTV